MYWKLKKNIPTAPASVEDLIEGDLDEVEELDLGVRGLTRLPDDIDRLINLKYLNVSYNPLTSLPPRLDQISLDSLALSVVSPQIDSVLRRLSTVRGLRLDDVNTAQAVAAIDAVPLLERADLNGESLTEVPATLRRHDLHFLEVNHSVVADLPDWIGDFPNLRDLDLASNRITRLPKGLARLDEANLTLSLRGNPLEEPFASLYRQGIGPLFAYLRSLPDPEPEPTVPDQRRGPVLTRVVEGRLELAPEPEPGQASRPELAALHAEVRDWLARVRQKIGANKGFLDDFLIRCQDRLSADSAGMQVLALALATERLARALAGWRDEDDGDPLTSEERVMCDALLGNLGMLLNWTEEWRAYRRQAESDPVLAEAIRPISATLDRLAQALAAQPKLAAPILAATLAELSRATQAPEPATPVVAREAADSLHNTLVPLTREALSLTVTADDRKEIRKVVVKGAVVGVGTLAVLGGSFIQSHAGDLLQIAQLLPADFGWLRNVVEALKTFAGRSR
ncbi:MAG: leucine-rich repeat domain-containing protein [Alphaproteobacteria bacterium]|nr:leucine-rich repeat domain-containing protein [Alphaproteobacteria bacterium]